jgi:hypothetical protein
MSVRKQLKPDVLDAIQASLGSNSIGADATEELNEHPPHLRIPQIPYFGHLFHHIGGIELFYVFLTSCGVHYDPALWLRHKIFPQRYTQEYLEKLVPGFNRLDTDSKRKLDHELSQWFSPAEIEEIFITFGSEFDILTGQVCCIWRDKCAGSQLRRDISRLPDPSVEHWFDFAEDEQASMSFRVEGSGW